MRILLFGLLFFLNTFPAFPGQRECKDVRSLAPQVYTEKGKIIRKIVTVKIEPIWSIHGGRYPNILIEDNADQGVLTFSKDGKKEIIKFHFKKTREGSLSDQLKLAGHIRKWVSLAPAEVLLEIKNNDKTICTIVYPIIKGE